MLPKLKTSRTLALLCVPLALALTFAGWSAFRFRASADLEAQIEARREAAVREQAPLVASIESPTILSPAQPPPVATNDERVTAARSDELELADAIWINGRLLWPEGTPIGEEVDVIATGKAFKSREMHRARVEPSGNFRVAVAPDTRNAMLSIDASHVFLRLPTRIKIKDGKQANEALLEPKLGGSLLGHLRLPPAAEGVAQELVGMSVNSYGWVKGDIPSMCSRSALVDAKLCFELRGLDPAPEHTLQFISGVVAEASLEHLRVEAGVTRMIDLDLQLGVRLRGRVSSAGSEKALDMQLVSSSEPEQGSTESERLQTLGYGDVGAVSFGDPTRAHAELDDEGRFDMRGVAAGRIELRATATQRTAAILDLGVLADGDSREGLEFELGLGGQIGGVVRWPDGSAAVSAQIDLEFAGDEEARREDPDNLEGGRIGRVLTNASGEFLINGLVHGPFHVLVEAASREPLIQGKPRPPTWKVKVEGVAIGTRDLELVLQGGYSIHGIVLDDAGAPIERFSVSATLEGDNGAEGSKAVSAKFRSKDGRFELDGLLAGTQRIEAFAARHEAPEPLRIQVPADSGPFTLVAVRRGSISGFVQLPDGTPAARASLHTQAEFFAPGGDIEGRANARGEFKLSSVAAGSLTLRARLEGYAASDGYPLQIAPGQSLEGVRLTLRHGARISGEVHPSREGETLSGREVNAYLSGGSAHFNCKTDEQGQFLFEAVDPGSYTIMLQANAEELASLMRPDESGAEAEWQLAQELMKTALAQVEEGGEVHVVFGSTARARIKLSGTVRRDNDPATFVRVRAVATDAADARDTVHGLSDASGRFELSLVQAGKYRVYAQPGGANSMPTVQLADVPSAGLTGLDLVLGSGRISGHVHAQSGAEEGWLMIVLERSESDRAWSNKPAEGAWQDRGFAFESVQAGSYTLIASAYEGDGQGRPHKSLVPVRMPITLEEGQRRVDLLIEIPGH